jgi:hypothetical protein
MESRESALVMQLGYPDPYTPVAAMPDATAPKAA